MSAISKKISRILKVYSPGFSICLAIALVANYIGKFFPIVGAPVIAIFIGMMLNQLVSAQNSFQQGISFSTKYILQLAVVFLGFSLNLNQVFAVGVSSLPIILSTVSISLLIAFLIYQTKLVEKNTAILVGVGSAICGGSAIAATAPIINAEEEDIAKSISVIFLFNILAAVVFPTLGQILNLSNDGFAIFAGTAVNDTSSVTATAASWDAIYQANTLDAATVIKLTRTLAIIPITLLLSIKQNTQVINNKEAQKFSISKIFPKFLLFFILASLITTIISAANLNLSFLNYFKTLAKFLIIISMAAIGLRTNVVSLVKKGKIAILLGFCCWLSIIFVDLFLQYSLNLW